MLLDTLNYLPAPNCSKFEQQQPYPENDNCCADNTAFDVVKLNMGGLLSWWWLACRWHAAWQERCQALDRLRVCISRKRISFRLFKQWYWESFDDDVQVRDTSPASLHELVECAQHSCDCSVASSVMVHCGIEVWWAAKELQSSSIAVMFLISN